MQGVVGIAGEAVKLRIEMLGGFTIINNGTRITEQARKSSKIWRLLQYLIVNRYRLIPQEELLEVFCDEEVHGNPGSVMRTMVYRVRGALAKGGLANADALIIAKSGGYSWNNKIECTTDTEEFEALLKSTSADELSREEKLEILLQAAALYKGDFLPNSTSEMWVMPLVRWYRSLYLACVHDALGLMEKMERSKESE